jgi:hypothetical protein
VAAVDLAVGKDGRLADPPAVIALPASAEVVEPPADLQAVQLEIKDLDQRIADARYQNDKAVYTASGEPEPMPGRVDAYRFITFYLDSGTANFEDFFMKVVDPIWLQGNDPAAAAPAPGQPGRPQAAVLAGAAPGHLRQPGPACQAPSRRATGAEGAPRTELQQRLRTHPAARPVRPTHHHQLYRAGRGDPQGAGRPPELVPHAEAIAGFLARYYGVDTMPA